MVKICLFGMMLFLLSCGRGNLAPLTDALQVSAGNTQSCAVIRGGSLKCWGMNTYGQLGTGTGTDTHSAVTATVAPGGVTQVVTGTYTTCALADGGVQCWGYNYSAGFGDGTTDDSLTPKPVTGLTSGVTSIIGNCALKDGGVWCWGANSTGQLADGTTTRSLVPKQIATLESSVTSLAGTGLSCALQSSAAKCWGLALAITSYTDSNLTYRKSVFSMPTLTSNVTAISAGYTHRCAIQEGAAKCIGYNFNGQLGDGTLEDSHEAAVSVSGLTEGVTEVTVGWAHSCAVMNSEVYCWGDNGVGQLGTGSTVSSTVPIKVEGLSGATGLSSSYYTTCAIKNGGVLCWGLNHHGNVGDGTNENALTPKNVVVAGTSQSSLVDTIKSLFVRVYRFFFY